MQVPLLYQMCQLVGVLAAGAVRAGVGDGESLHLTLHFPVKLQLL